MTKDEMIGWFKSAPMGSRHERMLWAARKIARLTGATEGGSYQMLLIALIGAERRLYPEEFNDCAWDVITRRYEYRSACGSVFDWLGLRALGFDYTAFDGAVCASTWLLMAMDPPPFARKKSPQEKRWKKLARIESLMKPTAQD